MATFVEQLNRLVGGPLTTTMTMSGAVRVELRKQIPWAPLRRLLAEHDKELRLYDGVATFKSIGEEQRPGQVLPEPSKVLTAGPITAYEYNGLTCTSSDLNLAADTENVLRVMIGSTVTVQKVNPSDIKDGLHHLHRRGKVTATHRQPKRYTAKSRAAKLSKERLYSRHSLIKKAKTLVGL